MGSLSNLYISSSFQSLLHFGSDNTASIALTEIEDGFGNGLGFYLNSIGSASLDGDLSVGGDFIVSGAFDIEGKVTVNDNVRVNGNLEVSGSTKLTGSLVVSDNISASNMLITNDLNVGGTLFASKVVTLIESSSIIYSSGSNILGDEIADTQTLIGSVIMSGSSSLTGSMGITDNLNVLGNISSSTISGIGNVTTYSASVQSKINILNTSASLALVTASFDLGTRNLTLNKGNNDSFSLFIPGTLIPSGTVSSSAQINIYDTENFATFNDAIQFDIGQKLFTSSFNSYTSSTNVSINALNTFTASINVTTGSNTFTGKQTYSASIVGQVIDLSVVGNTASMDCRLGNFFQLSLPTSSVNLNPSNIQRGQTITLRITQNATPTTVTYPTSIKFPFGQPYLATQVSGAIDILTFVSYDSSSLFAVATNRLT